MQPPVTRLRIGLTLAALAAASLGAFAAAPPPAPPAPVPQFSQSLPCVPRLSTDHLTLVGASGVYRRDVLALSVATDRARISTAGADGVLHVRNTVSGVDFCVANANVLAFSADGRYGAGVALNPTWKDWRVDGGAALVVWDLSTGAELRRLVLPLPHDLVLGVSNTGVVAYAGEATPLHVWDGADPQKAEPRALDAVTAAPRWLGFSADGKTLIAVSDGGADLVALATGKISAHLTTFAPTAAPAAAPAAPAAITATSQGKRLFAFAASAGGQALIEVWDPALKKAKLSLPAPTVEIKGPAVISGLALSPDDKVLAVMMKGVSSIYRFEVATGKALDPLTLSSPPSALTWSGDGEWLLAGTADGLLGAWDKAGAVIGNPPVSVIVAEKPSDQVGNRLLVGEKDAVRLMEGSSQRWTSSFERPPWEAVRLSPNGNLAWTGGNSGSVIYDAESGKELWRGSDYGHSYDARFSSDESEIVINSLKGLISFKSKNGRLVRTFVGGGGTAPIALSRDDKRVAGITGDHFLTVWSTLTGRPQGQSNMGENARPSGVAFSADGRWILTAELSVDQVGSAVHLWNGEDATPVDALSFAPLKVDPYRINLNSSGQLEVTTRQNNVVVIEVR